MSPALCTGALHVHMLMLEDAGVNLAEGCRSREGCQDTWWLCRSFSSLELNYCLTRSSQMWPWNGGVMRDRKNNPLIINFPIINCRFCFSSTCTGQNLTHTHFLRSLTAVCSLPIYKALLTDQSTSMQNNNKQKDTYPSFLSCFSESLSHCQLTIILNYCLLQEARIDTETVLRNLITKC